MSMTGDILNFVGGKPVVVLGTDGTDLYGITTDSDGHLQLDILSSALPTGAATQTTLGLISDRVGAIVSPPSGTLLQRLGLLADRLGALASPVSGSVNYQLGDAVTALQLIDDLRNALDSVGTDELDVNVEQAVPPVPASIVQDAGAVNVGTGTWTTVTTYTVTTGKTLYIHYWSAAPSVNAAGFVFMARLDIGGAVRDSGMAPAGDSVHVSFPSPMIATSTQVVVVQTYHAEAGAEWCRAAIVGFEV